MKRFLLILNVLSLFLTCGCSSGVLSSRRDMEHLRPIQTISLDRAGDGVELGVSSGIGPDSAAPLVMRCVSTGIEPAIDTLQAYSPEDELFYAHVRYIMIGESMAEQSILPLIDWVERSPSMRMDTMLLLVQGSAADALTGSSGENTDITEHLAALEREKYERSEHIYTLREVAAALLERGSSLCLAVRAVPSDDVILAETEPSDAVLDIGYAVLREGSDAVYLTEEETIGAELLEGGVNGGRTELDGNVLTFFSDGAEVFGLWDGDGALTGILIRCDLRAGILERRENSEDDPEKLEADFSEAAAGWLEAVIVRSQQLGSDFLDLRGMLDLKAPARARLDDWDEIFPTLRVTVSTDGKIDRSYDLTNQGVTE